MYVNQSSALLLSQKEHLNILDLLSVSELVSSLPESNHLFTKSSNANFCVCVAMLNVL